VGFPEEDAHERTVIGDNAIDRLTAGVETSAALRSIRGCLAGMNGIEITDLTWTRGTYEPLDARPSSSGSARRRPTAPTSTRRPRS
jgi:hypothetical protein